MTDDSAEPIDLVYTWVDDSWPGFRETLRSYARTAHDLDPSRTRDNLDLLRYSLRSVAFCAPWVRRIHIVTCRPQVPAWLALDHPRIRIVHHDVFMPADVLPTFSSFAIGLHLHRIPGVSQRFLHMNDDMLLRRPLARDRLVTREGRVVAYADWGRPRSPRLRDDPTVSPWNAALGHANHLLTERFGAVPAAIVKHVPRIIDCDVWSAMIGAWPREAAHTAASRFRSIGDVPPYYLYLQFALATGRGVLAPLAHTLRDCFYFPLEDRLWQMRLQAAAAACLRPTFVTLNDNLGAVPDARVVTFIRGMLDRWYPRSSPFERAP